MSNRRRLVSPKGLARGADAGNPQAEGAAAGGHVVAGGVEGHVGQAYGIVRHHPFQAEVVADLQGGAVQHQDAQVALVSIVLIRRVLHQGNGRQQQVGFGGPCLARHGKGFAVVGIGDPQDDVVLSQADVAFVVGARGPRVGRAHDVRGLRAGVAGRLGGAGGEQRGQ